MFTEIDTNKRDILHDGLLHKETPCQHTAHRVVGAISLHTNYPVEFKIKMVELSYKPDISVAQLAREHGINDNLLFKWRQYWREGKLRSSQQPDISMPALIPVTLDAEIKPANQPLSPPAKQESLPLSCEITFRHGALCL
ncbi:transposase [Budvicia aquatica]|nr:transposase [Budvicia aquatica]